jgi:hypothetical protein
MHAKGRRPPYVMRAAVFSTTFGIEPRRHHRGPGSDATLTYRVQSIDVLSKDEVARNSEEIFAQTWAGRLVPVTCGNWDGKSWRSNVMPTATSA